MPESPCLASPKDYAIHTKLQIPVTFNAGYSKLYLIAIPRYVKIRVYRPSLQSTINPVTTENLDDSRAPTISITESKQKWPLHFAFSYVQPITQ